MTPQIDHLMEKQALGMWPLKFWGFQQGDTWGNVHLWGFQGDRCKPRHVTPQIKFIFSEVSTHISGILMWENVHFESIPRHVTPQINCLGKTSPVLRVSTHIYGVSKEIDGKTFIFRVNLGMWPLKSIVSEKQALFWGFQHTFMVFPRR